jgi:signal peptidase II
MRLKNRLFWIVASIALALDQLTKYCIVKTIAYKQTIPLLAGVFHFTYVTNTGAAFSLLTGKVDLLRWLSLVASLALIAFAYFEPNWEATS